ncbi:MAG: ATP-binding protein [Bacillota bacterium]|nr:ATP-binding protein [Bacillota bacterium]
MKKNILFKSILLITVFTLITSIYLVINLRNSYTEEKIEELKNYNDFFETALNKSENTDINKYLQDFDSNSEIRITVIRESGDVIFDSDEDFRTMSNHSNREEVILALNEGEGISKRFSSTLKQEMIYYGKYYEKNQEIFILRTAIPISSIYYFTKNILTNYIFIFLIGLGLTIFTAYSIINKLENNYKKIDDAVSRINNGYYGEKLVIQDEEFKSLINNFNSMSLKISKKIENLEFENNSLNSIFKSMKDGVVVIDDDKKIFYNNPIVKNLFSIENSLKEKKLSDIVRNYELNKFIDLFYKNLKLSTTEIEINDKILQFTINSLKGYSNRFRTGAVLIIQDITEIRKLERIRSDFIGNVTHELKTPLTSIKGFIETLKNSKAVDRKTEMRFYDIIDLETERLSNLINDMLVLSEIETTKGKNIEYKVNKAVEEVLDLLSHLRKEKKVDIIVNHAKDAVIIKGDRDRFKQMLINLIDNGIKYNNQGGYVQVSYKIQEDKLILKVKDNGIGIEEKDIDRIFERFYRADKSRHRGTGGTGLGLAIVKHIVKSFYGEVVINSELNKGTEITIKIPVN